MPGNSGSRPNSTGSQISRIVIRSRPSGRRVAPARAALVRGLQQHGHQQVERHQQQVANKADRVGGKPRQRNDQIGDQQRGGVHQPVAFRALGGAHPFPALTRLLERADHVRRAQGEISDDGQGDGGVVE